MTSRIVSSAFRQPRRFGRGRRYILDAPSTVGAGWSDDARLFATTFVGGLLFMTIYLG